MTPKADIDSLLEQARKQDQGPGCWRQTIEGPALEFIERIETEGVENFSIRGISRSLREVNYAKGPEALRWHYNGNCKCPR